MLTEPSNALMLGITAAVFAVLGVEPQALVWSMVGAIFGAPLAPPAGRLRQVAVFVAVVLACALLGHWAADSWHDGSVRARNAWCLISAAVFHPASSAFVSSVPGAVRALIHAFTARAGGGGNQGGNS